MHARLVVDVYGRPLEPSKQPASNRNWHWHYNSFVDIACDGWWLDAHLVKAVVFFAVQEEMACNFTRADDGKNLIVVCGDWFYATEAFHICGSSVALAETLMPYPATLKRFLPSEDAFLLHELAAVCEHRRTGECSTGHAELMAQIDVEMKKHMNPMYLFYHRVHIDTARNCTGAAPSTGMSDEALGCRELAPALSRANSMCAANF